MTNTHIDEVRESVQEAERNNFIYTMVKYREDIAKWVDEHMGWNGKGKHDRLLGGSLNCGCVVSRTPPPVDDGKPNSVFIRFVTAGTTYHPMMAEKMFNEVMVLKYLRENTTIPVPKVIHYGTKKHAPLNLGPFIMMEFKDGAKLAYFLAKPPLRDKDPLELDPQTPRRVLEVIYTQIARWTLELSKLELPRVGAISNRTGNWDVIQRPMTYDMNELLTFNHFPSREAPQGPLRTTQDWFYQRSNELFHHLLSQPNICRSPEEVSLKAAARSALHGMVPGSIVDEEGRPDPEGRGTFRLFCDDFGPHNMLIDPETCQITTVFDVEFTNAMPAQYLHDVPSWLLIAGPHTWLQRGDRDGFERLFVPQMELFLQCMERVERPRELFRLIVSPPETRPLATQMRESWQSGRFWFNYAMRTSVDADLVYYQAIHGRGWPPEVLPQLEDHILERLIEGKMEQLEDYEQRKRENRFIMSGEWVQQQQACNMLVHLSL